jgi:hypothetical protein
MNPESGGWQRILFFAGWALFAVANWPFIVLINRIEPVILGLPLFVFVMFVLNLLVAGLLALAYRKLH